MAPPEPVEIAILGDQGMSDDARAVLRLIADEGTDLVLHAGDFDYDDDPAAWEAMLDEELGEDLPFVATIGNHDVFAWDGYREVLLNRAARAEGLSFTGDIGLQSTFTYKAITIVVASPGACTGDSDERFPKLCQKIESEYDHTEYVADQLRWSNSMWRIAMWHMVTGDYQVGDKGGQVALQTYDAARQGGAIIASAHNHAYARTCLMSDFANKTVESGTPPYTIEEGKTFNLISAIGGESFYETSERKNAEYWEKTYTCDDDDSTFGAFFATFRPDATGECYFKNIEGDVVDGPFEIESGIESPAGVTRAPVHASSD